MSDRFQIPGLDCTRLRQGFDRVSGSYDEAAVLAQEIARRMLERLDLVRLAPDTVLDLGCATGYATDLLLRRYRAARVLAVDFVPAMLHRCARRGRWLRRPRCVAADARQLPFGSGSADLVFSNLMLHWCEQPDAVLRECRRILRPGGLLMFSTLGPDTLAELRQSWAAVDGNPHVHPFLDMHDIGDAVLRSQFADPVMDVEHVQLTYATGDALLRDLRRSGAGNAATDRFRGLTGKGRLREMLANYEAHRIGDVLPVTYEVVYGHAWAPVVGIGSSAAADGEATVPLSQLGGRRT